jgi:D-beta-D-heptose 7-phosphate kinase/D-beta-D-heptose 1-phosphate adenosyltransferase
MTEQNTQQQKSYKILLIGDECVDEYQYGTVDRISPEAPVPVFKPGTKEVRPGMAGNVQENLKALGLEVESMLGDAGVKTRLIDSRSRQHIARIDQDRSAEPLDLSSIDFNQYCAVVISDYNKGSVTYEAVENIVRIFSGPVFVDTKKPDLSRFHGCIVKINESEYSARYSVNDSLIVTLGDRGAVWRQYRREQFFNARSVEIADVCGAGDTFLAALVYQYLETNSLPEAIEFAIQASAITVQHIGVYAPTLEEIK